MMSVPVRANSYMLAHGTRPAARPRSTVAVRCSTHASTVMATPTRNAGERPYATDASPSAFTARAPPRPADAPTAAPTATFASARAGTSAAAVTAAPRLARSIAKAMKAIAYTTIAEYTLRIEISSSVICTVLPYVEVEFAPVE